MQDFLDWAKADYREHPNSYKRIKTSLASAREFLGNTPISLIDDGRIEEYKTWRANEHEVREITIRHDLHALSTFFGYAIRQHWTRENPISNLEIPSDADAVRMHILTPVEEKIYFERAAKMPNLYDVGRVMLNQLNSISSSIPSSADAERRSWKGWRIVIIWPRPSRLSSPNTCGFSPLP